MANLNCFNKKMIFFHVIMLFAKKALFSHPRTRNIESRTSYRESHFCAKKDGLEKMTKIFFATDKINSVLQKQFMQNEVSMMLN